MTPDRRTQALYLSLILAAGLVVLAAVVSVPVAIQRKVAISYVVGATTGTALVLCGATSVMLALG